MVSAVSGNNLATSVREFDRITPPTQNETLARTVQTTNQAVLQAKTDTVNISKEALAMSKDLERPGEWNTDRGER